MTTLNPSDKASDIVLSNGNLTATLPSVSTGYRNVRATTSKTGKYVFEVTVVSSSGVDTGFGLARSGASLSNYLGIDTNSAAVFDGAVGAYYNNVAQTGASPDWSNDDTMMVAVDTTAGKWWLCRGGTWYGGTSPDPATGSGGWSCPSGVALFPAIGLYVTGHSYTANFGGSAFTNSIPSGFAAWDGGTPPGVATETDAALALAARQITATGRSNEADTALALGGKAIRATGRSDETDTPLALGNARPPGRSDEADTALPLGVSLPIGLSSETDTALRLPGSIPLVTPLDRTIAWPANRLTDRVIDFI